MPTLFSPTIGAPIAAPHLLSRLGLAPAPVAPAAAPPPPARSPIRIRPRVPPSRTEGPPASIRPADPAHILHVRMRRCGRCQSARRHRRRAHVDRTRAKQRRENDCRRFQSRHEATPLVLRRLFRLSLAFGRQSSVTTVREFPHATHARSSPIETATAGAPAELPPASLPVPVRWAWLPSPIPAVPNRMRTGASVGAAGPPHVKDGKLAGPQMALRSSASPMCFGSPVRPRERSQQLSHNP